MEYIQYVLDGNFDDTGYMHCFYYDNQLSIQRFYPKTIQIPFQLLITSSPVK